MSNTLYFTIRKGEDRNRKLGVLFESLKSRPMAVYNHATLVYEEFQMQWEMQIPAIFDNIDKHEKRHKIPVGHRSFGDLKISYIIDSFQEENSNTIVFYTKQPGSEIHEIQAFLSFEIAYLDEFEPLYINTFGVNKRIPKNGLFVSGSNIFEWFYRTAMLKSVGFQSIRLDSLTSAIFFWRMKSRFIYVFEHLNETNRIRFQQLDEAFAEQERLLRSGHSGKDYQEKMEVIKSRIAQLKANTMGVPMIRHRSKTPSPSPSPSPLSSIEPDALVVSLKDAKKMMTPPKVLLERTTRQSNTKKHKMYKIRKRDTERMRSKHDL
jgi:hypothetical protein